MLRIVLDTNVLIASISQKSSFYWVWEAFIRGKYELFVTTEILNEYAEVIEKFYSVLDANNTITQMLPGKNLIQIIRYYKWQAITQVPEYNKFFDCAVACNAHYLVSEDKHFNILKEILFPSVMRIRTDEFKTITDKLE